MDWIIYPIDDDSGWGDLRGIEVRLDESNADVFASREALQCPVFTPEAYSIRYERNAPGHRWLVSITPHDVPLTVLGMIATEG